MGGASNNFLASRSFSGEGEGEVLRFDQSSVFVFPPGLRDSLSNFHPFFITYMQTDLDLKMR